MSLQSPSIRQHGISAATRIHIERCSAGRYLNHTVLLFSRRLHKAVGSVASLVRYGYPAFPVVVRQQTDRGASRKSSLLEGQGGERFPWVAIGVGVAIAIGGVPANST
jgi:hypothetical protein